MELPKKILYVATDECDCKDWRKPFLTHFKGAKVKSHYFDIEATTFLQDLSKVIDQFEPDLILFIISKFPSEYTKLDILMEDFRAYLGVLKKKGVALVNLMMEAGCVYNNSVNLTLGYGCLCDTAFLYDVTDKAKVLMTADSTRLGYYEVTSEIVKGILEWFEKKGKEQNSKTRIIPPEGYIPRTKHLDNGDSEVTFVRDYPITLPGAWTTAVRVEENQDTLDSAIEGNIVPPIWSAEWKAWNRLVTIYTAWAEQGTQGHPEPLVLEGTICYRRYSFARNIITNQVEKTDYPLEKSEILGRKELFVFSKEEDRDRFMELFHGWIEEAKAFLQ